VASRNGLSLVRDAHSVMLERGVTPVGVRDLVADSWLRSVAAGVNVDVSEPPVTMPADLLVGYRAGHPLARIFPMLYDVLGRAAEECDCVMAVADAQGQLLWVCGKPAVMRRAESIMFVEGAQWDERHAGTNAPGTALRLDVPVTIRSAEHFARPVQGWSCTAVPIHHPQSREILGVVDITGGDDVGSPQTLAMVRAAARMAEAELARLDAVESVLQPGLARERHGGRGQHPAHHCAAGLRVKGLGRPDCLVTADGPPVRLSPRHSEIVVILAAHPDGLSGDELAMLLYPGDVISCTPRAELVRLRALLGPHLLASRPYRLTCDVTSDWAAVAARLAVGQVSEALRLYSGPLLPHSQAPGVVTQREDLQHWLRTAVLASTSPEDLLSWTMTWWGADDLEIWQRQCEVLPARSPLLPLAETAVARLDAEFSN